MKHQLTKIMTGAGAAGTTLFVMASSAMAQVNVGTAQLSKGFASNLGSMLTSVLTIVMAIAALAVFMYLIWGGIGWITSGGDKGKTEEARNKITAAVIGLIVLAAAYALLLLMLNILGFQSLNEVFTSIVPINNQGSGPAPL